MRRWAALGAYTVLLYGLLPYGPAIGLAAQRSAVGRWGLGPGIVWLTALGALAFVVRLVRRNAPAWSYGVLATAAVGYFLALSWLRAQRLERVHLPEYGIAAWLAYRAIAPGASSKLSSYVAAALLAAAIGWGDELVQAVTPGRVYDLRDVAANALGALLGTLVLIVWRSGEGVSAGSSSRR